MTGNIYERLITYDLKDVSKLKGELAESWTAGADGKTYTFKMRKGIKFHSGNPVTAQDAAYSLQRAVIMNKTPGSSSPSSASPRRTRKEKIRATDDQTLVIETGEAVAPTFFYYCLTAVIGGMVDMKTVQSHEKDGDFGNEWLKTNSAGSGPFKLDQLEGEGVLHPRALGRVLGHEGAAAPRGRPPRAGGRDPAPPPREG